MTDKSSKYLSLLPFNNFSIYDCSDEVTMRLYTDADEKLYEIVRDEFLQNGFEELSAHNLGNCTFSTLLRVKEQIHLIFSVSEKTLRVVDDDFSALVNLRKTAQAGLCPVKLWQFEVDHSLIDCGMCYIFQCSDYSFFVIDSAHPYSVNDDIRIYEFLRKHTPSSMPVRVAGWFFSHGHEDHTGKFRDILKHNKDIIIEGLYFNIVSNEHFSCDDWSTATKTFAADFVNEAKESKIPIYKLHSGQHFFIKDLEITVLCTHEDVFPESLENYNDSSTVIMVKVGEDKVCFPGDAGGRESVILENRYPDDLKCDIMQIAHHGHFGTSVEFYKKANARVALFATTQIKYDEEFPRYEANRVAVALAEHTFIASNGSVEFTFPLKNSSIVKYPDETFENFEGIYNLWAYEYNNQFKEGLKKQYFNLQKTDIFDY